MCNLPDGVRLLAVDFQQMSELYLKAMEHPRALPDDQLRDPEVFTRYVFNRDTVVLQIPDGVIFLVDVRLGLRAEAVFWLWQGALTPHTTLIRELLVWAFLQYDLLRVECFVADYARATRRFLTQKLGFTHEGILRHYLLFEGRPLDMHVFSLLREEVLL